MADPPTPVITVTTETRQLKTLPFRPSSDQMQAGQEWEEWCEGIEREFRYFKITDAQDKKDAMIIYGGKDLARLEKSLTDLIDGDVYQKLRRKLNDYYTPKKNKHHARYNFLKMRPIEGEPTNAYAARLREKVPQCEFSDADEQILEHTIQTIDNTALIQKTINKSWDLERMLTEAAQMEDTQLQMKDMRDDLERRVNKLTYRGLSQRSTNRHNEPMRDNSSREKSGPPGVGLRGAHTENQRLAECGYCGRKH